MTDRHAVFAVLTDHSKVRLTPWLDWASAIERWNTVDDIRIKHLTSLATPRQTNVRHFVVRAEGDPAWSGAELKPEVIFATTGKGAMEEKAVLRRIGAERGLEGREGGWIYQTDTGRRIVQGWASYARQWQREGRYVTTSHPDAQHWNGRRRFHLNLYRHAIAKLQRSAPATV